jgi:hypothetical protein
VVHGTADDVMDDAWVVRFVTEIAATGGNQYSLFVNDLFSAYVDSSGNVRGRFIDNYGFVLKAFDPTRPQDDRGYGDSHWSTGLAITASTLQGENTNVVRFLTALLNSGFEKTINGSWEPIRYPGRTGLDQGQEAHDKFYSSDPFGILIASCHYVWKFGDETAKGLARALLMRYLNVLYSNGGRLGHDAGDATVVRSPTLLLSLTDVTGEMGIPRWGATWLPSILDTLGEGIKQVIAPLKDQVREWLGKPSIKVFGVKHKIPMNIRNKVVSYVFLSVDTAAEVLSLPRAVDRELGHLGVNKKLRAAAVSAVNSGMTGLLGVSPFDQLAVRAIAFYEWYKITLGAMVAATTPTGNDSKAVQFYGAVHLPFWDYMINDEFHPTLLPAMEPLKQAAAAAAVPHRNALYYLLDRQYDRVRPFLSNWNPLYSRTDYMWQNSGLSQDKFFATESDAGKSARLDYMVLHGLYEMAFDDAGKGGNPASPSGHHDDSGQGSIIVIVVSEGP